MAQVAATLICTAIFLLAAWGFMMFLATGNPLFYCCVIPLAFIAS